MFFIIYSVCLCCPLGGDSESQYVALGVWADHWEQDHSDALYRLITAAPITVRSVPTPHVLLHRTTCEYSLIYVTDDAPNHLPLLGQAYERREGVWTQSDKRGGECGPRHRDHLPVWRQRWEHRGWGQLQHPTTIIKSLSHLELSILFLLFFTTTSSQHWSRLNLISSHEMGCFNIFFPML